MRWIEAIKVRALDEARSIEEHLTMRFLEKINLECDEEGLKSASILKESCGGPTFAVILQWEREVCQPTLSRLGAWLTSNLDAYGITRHDVWIEHREKSFD